MKKNNITKDELIFLLLEGYTNKEIADIEGISKSYAGYLIQKYGLTEYQPNAKKSNYTIERIDSIGKAYLVGFIACDGYINQSNSVEVSIQMNDSEVLYYLSEILDCDVNMSRRRIPEHKQFPKARITKKITDITKFVGGRAKKERHLPIVSNHLTRYLLLGAFDADGCITWGRRKDRNRIWQKVSFTTSYDIAICIQKMLLKHLGISTAIRPKTGCDCYVIDFSDRNNVLKFLDYIYQDGDFVILHRKYNKYNALRLELEENGGTAKAQYRAEPAEQEGVETSGGVATYLNNHISIQG